MKQKYSIVFVLAVAISFFAASYRFGDSAHSIGIINTNGGKARHPSYFESGKGHYMLISTATVIPPYKGDMKVVLEGTPAIDYQLYASAPAVDLGIRRLPKFKDNVYYGLRPKDRPAIWVEMKPPVLDPVCGMVHKEGFIKDTYRGKNYYFCSEGCRRTFMSVPNKYANGDSVTGEYTLAMYDMKTGNSVLRVPIIFKGKGDMADAGGHHH